MPNPGFREGKPGGLPAEWKWQIRPDENRPTAAWPTEGGRRALRIDAALASTDKPRDNYPIVVSTRLPAAAGPLLPPCPPI